MDQPQMTPAEASAQAGQAPAAVPPLAWQAPTVDRGPAAGIEWAGYGARLVAYILDGLILSVVFIVLSIVLAGGLFATLGPTPSRSDPSVAVAAVSGAFGLLLVVFLLAPLYFPFFWANGGPTPWGGPFPLP